MQAPESRTTDSEGRRRLRLDAIAELALLALTLFSLGLIAWVELQDLRWPDPRFKVAATIDLALVAVFLVDFVVRALRAADRREYLRRHWYDVLGLIPLYAESLSWLRLARLVRVARILRLLRVLSTTKPFQRTFRFLDELLSRNKLGHALLASAALLLSMAGVVWWLERDVNPNFRHFADALWWAVVTLTTVGYGDITPMTGTARVIAASIMLVGIGLIGIVASTLSSALITFREQEEQEARGETRLAGELERLSALHERGRLTDEEYTAAKRHVLGLGRGEPR